MRKIARAEGALQTGSAEREEYARAIFLRALAQEEVPLMREVLAKRPADVLERSSKIGAAMLALRSGKSG
jgi:hypothetical protein